MSKLMDLIAAKKAAIGANNRAKTVKPPEGTSSWRILPHWGGQEDGEFWHDFGQHFIKDTKGALKAVYVCTDKTYNQPCQVCEAIQHGIMSSPNDEIKKAMEDARASSRVLLNAVQVSGENPTKPEILELSPGVFGQILSIVTEWGEEVLSLEGGRVILIERVGKGLQTKYTVQASSKKVDLPAGIMKQVANLDDYVKQESAEQEKRAIANLKQVAGLLSAPGVAKPDLASVASELDALDVDADGTNDIGGAAPAAWEEPAKPAAAKEDAVSSPDLDALMKELEGI